MTIKIDMIRQKKTGPANAEMQFAGPLFVKLARLKGKSPKIPLIHESAEGIIMQNGIE